MDKWTNGKLATVAKQTDTEMSLEGGRATHESDLPLAVPAGVGKPEILDIMTPFSAGHVNNGRLTKTASDHQQQQQQQLSRFVEQTMTSN